MQLAVAIVQDEDAGLLCKRLGALGISFTRLNSVGGFLARGNVTLLAGIEMAQVEIMLDAIRKTCHTRKRFINPIPAGAEPAHMALAAPTFPLEVQVGGATVFFLAVKRFMRGTEAAPSRPAQAQPVSPSSEGAHPMTLLLSIVTSDAVEGVTRALLAANYRVTRINSAGGFLRRGNVTLLIGVEDAQVEDALAVIAGHCSGQAGRTDGAPASCATTFVLEATRTVRV